MDSQSPASLVNKPKYFLTKKCILAGTMLLFIFASLNIFIVTHAFTDTEYKKIVDMSTMAVFVIEVLVLYGIIQENIYATIVLAAATGILTFISAVNAYHLMLPWTIALIIFAINSISYSFIYDLWILRKLENLNKNNNDGNINAYQRFNQAV